ncbi:hypothetical protein GKC30_04750 [Pseudodesulfovibrio sp. F-1]|uniref:Uncharacterized protein n=1 Tax=Pseudodesulfovibrio alkaliphilus TaxID=2661613 RepID=A0A7K1KLL6_9BACT|nr:hypothetical protein [Pseudodesulfovibrio alkaliphilus]MUM76940.1 hypothetical protein [Pseudodesulfovibrio alkaliphilus]
MNIHDATTLLGESLSELLTGQLSGLTPEMIRLGAGAILGLAALTLLLIALRLLTRNRGGKAKRVNIARTLQHQGASIDLINDGAVAVRFVITAAASGKLTCEIIERFDTIKATEGEDVTCVFAPVRVESGRVNAFTARLVESDRSGRRADRIVLSAPRSYAMVVRRKHSRKRVADQQFIRVKLWMESPYASDTSFEDAMPHIGINSLSTEGAAQAANAVLNISSGGLGLSVQNHVIPETCAVGAAVTVNLFMFNFREKTFKPYWYSGTVRTMESGRPGFTRMGIAFDGAAAPLARGGLRWTRFD